MSNPEYDSKAEEAEHRSVLADERRKLSRAKETAEIAGKTMEKFIAEALKVDSNKQNLGREGIQTMKDSERGIDPVKDFLKGGQASDQRFGGEAREITGREPRPWEEDE